MDFWQFLNTFSMRKIFHLEIKYEQIINNLKTKHYENNSKKIPNNSDCNL